MNDFDMKFEVFEEGAYTTVVHVVLEDVLYFEYAFLLEVFVYVTAPLIYQAFTQLSTT